MTEIKYWVELFFDVKVIVMNSHRLPVKDRRVRPIIEHTMTFGLFVRVNLWPHLTFDCLMQVCV